MDEVIIQQLPFTSPVQSTELCLEWSVWLFTRPISLASLLSPLSQGKYPICHWGVLFSPHSVLGFNMILVRSKMSSAFNEEEVWGTLFELFRTSENINKPRLVPNFGRNHLLQEWRFASVVYIGSSRANDDELIAHGNTYFH